MCRQLTMVTTFRLFTVFCCLISITYGADYAIIETLHEKNVMQFCMIYFPEIKQLPYNSINQTQLLVDTTQFDGCNDVQEDLTNRVALGQSTKACSAKTSIENYWKAHASALILGTNDSHIDDSFIRNISNKPDIYFGYVSNSTASILLSMTDKSHPLKIRMFALKPPAFDGSLVVIWCVAVFCVTVGGFWSGYVRRDIYFHESGVCSNSESPSDTSRPRQHANQSSRDEESSMNVSPIVVTLFVMCMGVMLLLLYFFFQYLVYFIIVMFTLASIVSLIGVLEPIVYRIPFGLTLLPRFVCPCFPGQLEIRQMLLILFAISVSLTWVFTRHMEFSWILQDILGVAFSINMLKTLRLPSLMICTVLLVLLFFYDIFFVFITPFLTMKGDSVMVEVAKGGGSQEQLPMVLRVPHFNDGALAVCFSQYSLLGFGDILVPGMLIAYCHGFDLIRNTGRVYFATTAIMYGIGLIITFVALFLMRIPQPALLYLVPCTLIPVFILGLIRRELKDLWRGFPTAKISSQHDAEGDTVCTRSRADSNRNFKGDDASPILQHTSDPVDNRNIIGATPNGIIFSDSTASDSSLKAVGKGLVSAASNVVLGS